MCGELLPKLSLIRGDKTALQLMGGYWKLAPTDARGVRAVLTRAGWANSGPAFKRRNNIHKSNSKRNSNIFYVLICGVLLTRKVKTVRVEMKLMQRLKPVDKPFFPASVRKSMMDLMTLFSER